VANARRYHRGMDGIAWAASAMVAARTRLEIATENLANVSTDGFARIAARGVLSARGARIERAPERRQGSLRQTGRDLDFAILGEGAFALREAGGAVVRSRAGAFVRAHGALQDAFGRTLLGSRGPLRFPSEARLDERGRVVAGGRCVDALPLPAASRLQSGYLEAAGVNAIGEMIDVMAAERAFESAQKIVTAIDATREKSAQAARLA
jgi:flagellar basal body rod protein FlgG